MGGDYLSVWTERSGLVTVLKLRGELDAVTADPFADEAVRVAGKVPGPIAVDLRFLEFLDCTGARALTAVLDAIRPWRLAEVRGIQPQVARLLDLIGLDLTGQASHGDLVLSLRGDELLAQSRATRSQSQAVLLEASAAMARLAATYSELALSRQRRAEPEQAGAARMQSLSETARDLSTRYRERAMCGVA